jgi:hypothetical protein
MRRLALIALVLPALVAVPAVARADVSFSRTDVALTDGVKPSEPVAVKLADVDGVNGPDILTNLYSGGLSGTSDLGVQINRGDGTFDPLVRYPLCDGATDLVVADLDLDGHLDVATTCADGHLEKLLGDGHGGFGPVQEFSEGANGNRRDLEAAEVNGGGSPELVFVTQGGMFQGVICFAYAQDGLDTAPQCGNPMFVGGLPVAQPSPISFGPLLAVNFENTQRDEIIAAPAHSSVDKFAVYSRDPGTDYNSWEDGDYAAGNGAAVRRSVAAGDLDGDGDLDVVIGHGDSSNGTISTALNDGGIKADDPAIPTFNTILDPQQVAISDVDIDGKKDIIAANGYGDVAVHSGLGAGAFGPLQDIPLLGHGDPTKASLVAMDVRDVSCDGRPDVVVADYYAATVEILTNTSPGTPPASGCVAPAPTTPGGGTPTTPDPIIPLPKPPLPVFVPTHGVTSFAASRTLSTTSTTTTFSLGKVLNPPTASTVQTLGYEVTRTASAAAAKPKKKRRTFTVTVASGKTKVPAGSSKPLSFRLTRAGASALKKTRSLHLTMKITATAPNGKHGTITRHVTLRLKKPAAKKKR